MRVAGRLRARSAADGRSPPPAAGPGCSELSPEIVMFGDDDLLGDFTLLFGLMSALIGYLVTFYSTQKLQDRLARQARVESQLKDLYGPLRMLDIACFQAVTPMATLYGADERVADNVPLAIRFLAKKAAENPASNMAYDYRCVVPSHTRPSLDATGHG